MSSLKLPTNFLQMFLIFPRISILNFSQTSLEVIENFCQLSSRFFREPLKFSLQFSEHSTLNSNLPPVCLTFPQNFYQASFKFLLKFSQNYYKFFASLQCFLKNNSKNPRVFLDFPQYSIKFLTLRILTSHPQNLFL